MIRKILQQIMSLPFMYNLLQTFFGVQRKKKIIRAYLSPNTASPAVLDVGGGTGLYQDIWPGKAKYICLDNDLVKLNGYVPHNGVGYKVCGDAVQLPFNTDTVDYVFSSSMSHHVPEQFLDKMLCDMARVLKPDGELVFIDAVSIPDSRLNRFLWSLDRGEYPHTRQSLEDIINKYFHIKHLKTFSIYYDYLLVVAKKK